MILERINGPDDIKKLKDGELAVLAEEIRSFLIEKISRTGGHLASNLGVVELTMALFLAFDLPKDKIIWDVGHQSYTHKILSGRKENFDGLRQYGGLSGFPKRKESPFDAFDTGHSSTSISAGLGMALGRDVRGDDYSVISVIGDGALTGGMAYEALNNAAQIKKNFIIVLNDNNMSISKNVGGISSYLSNLRADEGYNELKKSVVAALRSIPRVGNSMVQTLTRTKNGIKQLLIPGMWFENMGVTYIGPVDGHNVRQLVRIFKEAKKMDHAVLIHVLTKKGKGYEPAEKNPSAFHGVEPFDMETGKPLAAKIYPSYTDVFSKTICQIAEKDKRVAAVTAAMPGGTGLSRFEKLYPERFFDVGIAEEHAVTSAAGMAAAGLRPVVAVYSSFLQRAYDQILHDVCIQNLPVLFCVDRAGLVGEDGETHHGVFDPAFLDTIPGMTVLCPSSFQELREMLRYAIYDVEGPVAVRYSRGGEGAYQGSVPVEPATLLRTGADITLAGYGMMLNQLLDCADRLARNGIQAEVVKLNTITPIPLERLTASVQKTGRLLVAEDSAAAGGVGQRITAVLFDAGIQVRGLALVNTGHAFVTHGTVPQLQRLCGLDGASLYHRALEVCRHG